MNTKQNSAWHLISLKYYKVNMPIISIIKIVILLQVNDEMQSTPALISA